MENQYSVDALIGFLDYCAEKGLVNLATAQARKTAVSKVLFGLDESESSDVRALDFDSVFQRFVNRNAKGFTPESLATYRSRFRTAMDDFLRYMEDPTSFKPSGSGKGGAKRSSTNDDSSRLKAKAKPKDSKSSKSSDNPPPPNPLSFSANNVGFSVPVPVRPGHVVRIENLPIDLTEAEADRLALIVKAYAVSKGASSPKS